MPVPGTRYGRLFFWTWSHVRPKPEDIALSCILTFTSVDSHVMVVTGCCVWLSCWFAIRYAFAAAYVAWLSTEVSMHVHANFLVYVLKFVFSCSTSIEREEHEK